MIINKIDTYKSNIKIIKDIVERNNFIFTHSRNVGHTLKLYIYTSEQYKNIKKYNSIKKCFKYFETNLNLNPGCETLDANKTLKLYVNAAISIINNIENKEDKIFLYNLYNK